MKRLKQKGPMLRYHQLNIMQKINVKANAVRANIAYKVSMDGWYPMDRAMSNYLQLYSEYSSPFKSFRINSIN